MLKDLDVRFYSTLIPVLFGYTSLNEVISRLQKKPYIK